MIRVGIPLMCSFAAVAFSVSVFSLAKAYLEDFALAVVANIGAKLRHGAHHGAQKSTTTGRGLDWIKLLRPKAVTSQTAA